jgi:hypothetical protein
LSIYGPFEIDRSGHGPGRLLSNDRRSGWCKQAALRDEAQGRESNEADREVRADEEVGARTAIAPLSPAPTIRSGAGASAVTPKLKAQ